MNKKITDQNIISAIRSLNLNSEQIDAFSHRLMIDHGVTAQATVKRQIKWDSIEFGTMQVTTYGDGVEPIILLQDVGVTGEIYTKLAEYLSHKYRVIVPELPPYLLKMRHLWEVYKNADDVLSEYIEFINEVKRAMNIDKFALLGHGYGGALAVKYATTYSENVEKLILIDPTAIPIGTRITTGVVRNFKSMFDYLRHADKIPYYLVPNFLKNIRSILFTYKIIFNLNMSRDLKKLRVESDVYWAEWNSVTPIEHGRQVANTIAGAKFTIIPKRNRTWLCDSPQNIPV